LSFPTSVNAGQTVTGTLLYTNTGPSPATGASFSLTLPANLAAPPAITGLPTGATASYAAGTGIVSFAGLPNSLAAGSSLGPIGISYTQPGLATSTVAASASATTNDPNTGNNAASVTVAGSVEADLGVALSFPASVNAGQTVTGTASFTNSGPSAASGVGLSLTLPANLTTAPALGGLPAGVSYSYAASTGVVSFSGFSGSLAASAAIGPITISYVQPGVATSTVTVAISATSRTRRTIRPRPRSRASPRRISWSRSPSPRASTPACRSRARCP
jgi:uncharacterized repeat protein (TIGR01451 family)